MEQKEEIILKEIRKSITSNWLKALDYLIKIGRVKSYRDFDARTGIINQRISHIKKYLNEPEIEEDEEKNDDKKGSFAHLDYVYVLHKYYGVSLRFMFLGELPILENERGSLYVENDKIAINDAGIEYVANRNINKYVLQKISNLESEVATLREMLLG